METELHAMIWPGQTGESDSMWSHRKQSVWAEGVGTASREHGLCCSACLGQA